MTDREEDNAPRYYLQDTRSYVGNCPLWWRVGGKGYTTSLEWAERYSLEDAMRQHQCRDTDVPWLCSEINALRRSTVDCQDVNKMRTISEQKKACKAATGGQP